MKPTARLSILSALCLVSGACYVQRPLETVPPPPSTRIVAQLTDSGTVAMGNALGPGVLGVEGVVATADQNEWTLQMVRTDLRDGRQIEWNREPVKFPRQAFTNTQVVRVDKTRSWLAGGLLIAGAFLAARAFNLLGASDGEPNEEPPPASLVPSGGR